MGPHEPWELTDDLMLFMTIALGGPLVFLPVIGQDIAFVAGSVLLFVLLGVATNIAVRSNQSVKNALQYGHRRRFWDDLLLFGRVLVVAGFLFLFLLKYALIAISVPAAGANLAFSVLPPVCGFFAVSLHRRDDRFLPSWLTVGDWTVWRDVELFGIVAYLIIVYTVSVTGLVPFLQLLTWILAPCCGTIVVLLRRGGVSRSGNASRTSA